MEESDFNNQVIECIEKQKDIIKQLVQLIDLAISLSIAHKSTKGIQNEGLKIPKLVRKVLPVMLQAVGSSSNSLLKLSEPGLQTRDCYSIIRSIVELSVNICYIIAEGNPVAERAIRHAHQKSYKDLQREINISDLNIELKYSSIPNPNSIVGLKNEIDEFTSHTGREKGWTDLSLDDRINIVLNKLGDPEATDLAFARFAIYRHSSEILHGTYFGVIYFWGITTPRSESHSLEKAKNNISDQLMMILMANIASLSAIIESFDKAYSCSFLIDELKKINIQLQDIKYLKDK